VKRLSVSTLFLLLCALACTHRQARSGRNFDEIRDLVTGKTAPEVERILGKPDSRETMVLSGERWIWWNYTYLDGSHYAPEERGRVVHLEIVFEPDDLRAKASNTRPELRVGGPLGVSYTLPKEAM